MIVVYGGLQWIIMFDGVVLEVKIFVGVYEGQIICLCGKGVLGYGDGELGDVLLMLVVVDDFDWWCDGNDIEIILFIIIDEVVLGGKVEVQIIDGLVMLIILCGVSLGQKLCLKGCGFKVEGGQCGDQYVVLKIVMFVCIDDDLVEFMQNWCQQNVYDLRRG